MPVNGNIQVQRSVLPDGIAGVDTTVRKIVELAHGVYGSKSAKIRALAIDIVRNAGVPDKDYYGEMVAIHNWVRDNIRYTRDPVGQETLSYPEETVFNSRAGDCDDMTTLEIALLGAIGIEGYPVVVGMFPNHFSHVYLHGKVPAGKGRNAGKVIPLDPIMKNWSAGREAANVKAKKLYPQLSNPMTMNGLPMSGDLGDLGAYAIAPSYLDTEDSHAGSLVVPDAKASNLHADKTVANSTRVNMPFEGLDGLFGGGFSETSAGDGGTIVESGGQLVPKGFIRKEPDLAQAMAMTPATSRDLGPRGPIFAHRASDNRDRLTTNEDNNVVSLAQQMRKGGKLPGNRVGQAVGVKRYELPSVQQATRNAKGLVANPVRPLNGNKHVRVLESISMDRLDRAPKPLPTLGEELAGSEYALAGFMQRRNELADAEKQRQPLAIAEATRGERISIEAKIAALEQRILSLRQQLRTQNAPQATKYGFRAAAVTAQEAQAVRKKFGQAAPEQPQAVRKKFGQPVNGLGEGIMDALKKPIVWGPIVAFVGVMALRMYLKKRRAAAAPAA